jgi:hypothetical protein
VKFSKEEINILETGHNYALEAQPKHYLRDLIIDTENAIQLDSKLRNVYRFVANKKIAQISSSVTVNYTHKRKLYIAKQIREELIQHNLTIAKADKGKTLIIIDKDAFRNKVISFLNENDYTKLQKDPTDRFQKQTQKTIQCCGLIIDTYNRKRLTQIKPTAPTLNALIKLHKDNEPIRPVVNNISAPTYKLAKFFKKWLSETLQLSNTYTVYNSIQLAQDLHNLELKVSHRLATFDIKDLYVNLPTQEILQITKSGLISKKLEKPLIQQALMILNTILTQNYCQFENSFYQPEKGVTMGSPISSIVAEVFLQHYEQRLVKYCLENKRILSYYRYVDILIIFDSKLISIEQIHTELNSLNQCLIFKLTMEENNAIDYLDLTLTRLNNSIDINIFRKPTTTDATIHYTSKHPVEHKLAAFRYMINRANNLPLKPETKQQEEKMIRLTAKNNGYPTKIIQNLQQRTTKIDKHNTSTKQSTKKWVTFKYYSPLVRKVTNIFKNTNLRIAFQATNTIWRLLNIKKKQPNIYTNSGVYSIKCSTCNWFYTGQTGRDTYIRFKEHIWYIRTNNPKWAFAVHILENNRQYDTTEESLLLITPCNKGNRLNLLENLYIQQFHSLGLLMDEQDTFEYNTLFSQFKTRAPLYTHDSASWRNHTTPADLRPGSVTLVIQPAQHVHNRHSIQVRLNTKQLSIFITTFSKILTIYFLYY